MLVTACGKVTLERLEHPSNRLLLIFVIPEGMVTSVRPVQFWKALEPMEETDSGMLISVRPVQFWKAFASMEETDSGILTSVILDPFTKSPGSSSTSLPMVTVSMLSVGILPLVEQLRAFQVSVLMALQPSKE